MTADHVEETLYKKVGYWWHMVALDLDVDDIGQDRSRTIPLTFSEHNHNSILHEQSHPLIQSDGMARTKFASDVLDVGAF